MSFDNSLAEKLEARTKKAYESREAAGLAEGISLFGKNFRLIPVMPAAFLSDLAGLQAGAIDKSDLLVLVEKCIEELDRPSLREVFQTKIVDVDFINDFLEFVIEYYSARPTDGPSTSSTTGEQTAPGSAQDTTPAALANLTLATP